MLLLNIQCQQWFQVQVNTSNPGDKDRPVIDKERDSVLLPICSLVRNTNGAFWGYLVQRSPHKTFLLHDQQIPSSQQNLYDSV